MVAITTIQRGWALTEQGKGEDGLPEIQKGFAAYQATDQEIKRSGFLGYLAEVYQGAGKIPEGLKAIEEGLTAVLNTGERFYEAELYRLKGELTLQQNREQGTGNGEQKKETDPRPTNPQSEAEACFHKAIEIARKQQAKSLELRATMSLARLWQLQGKTAEARQRLVEIYDWFTEGFNTKDLQEGKALLAELATT